MGIKNKRLVFLGIVLLWNTTCIGQQAANALKPLRPAVDIQQMLSWFPADTETIIVANGPFGMSNFQIAEDKNRDREISTPELEKTFESLALVLVNFKNSILEKHLEAHSVVLVVEGSRHFRPPHDLGETPYEGCTIAVLTDKPTIDSDLLMKNLAKTALRIEEVEGEKVAVFQEKLESDLWTSFVTFPQKGVVIVATNHDYLQTVLERMHGQRGARALPASLPEWKYVNKQAQFWGLRHFVRGQEQSDPTSPFGGKKSANLPDEQAIGIVFNYDRRKSGTATITYLSDDKNILPKIERELFPSDSEPQATKDLHIRYRELEPGVVEGFYELRHAEPIDWFFFVMMGYLGHAVYL